MKKILLLSKDFPYKYADDFVQAAKQVGVELIVAPYTDLVIKYGNAATITVQGHDVQTFGLVFFRTVGKYLEQAALLSEYCRKNSIPVFDSVFTHTLPWIDRKSFEYMRLSLKQLPIIKSWFVSPESFLKIKNEIQYPTIAKVTGSSQGEGVYLCASEKELETVFEKEKQSLILQEFVENTGDIRAIIVGGKVLGAIFRQRQDTNEFRNNVSLGGLAKIYQLTQDEETIALNAAKAMQYEIAGVDLIRDAENQVKIIEVNRSPQFAGFMQATQISVPLEIVKYLATKCR